MNSKKIVCLVSAMAMVFGMAACGNKKAPADTTAAAGTDVASTDATAPSGYVDPYAELAEDYDAKSEAIYNDVLGEFATAYDAAKAATDVNQRYALMAVAEAKLMESGVMLPLTTQGGNYAISRVAPYTITSVLWGSDWNRFHNALVCTDPIKKTDRDELKAMWKDLKGTGTWEAEAKKFLEGKGYTIKDTYTLGYGSDPQTWDGQGTSRSADSEAIVNTIDNLVEYDSENVLQPALAEALPEVSEDGLTYTFKIRQGVKWVDSQGREVGDLTAHDWVTGMQHVMDAKAGLEALLEGVIKNAKEYNVGEITDMNEVGVKAIDDYTLQYTLCQPTSYFTTMLGYGIFSPMNKAYYESQGGKFGEDFDASAADYTYGKDPDHIAYCGPYLVANATAKNTIVFKANPSYWNKDGITLSQIIWKFNDGKDATKAYNDTMNGTLDGAGLNSSSVEAARKDNVFDDLAYLSSTNATSFSMFHNVNRVAMANVADNTVQSPKTEEDNVRSIAALRNAHFRRAICFALDRANYNAMTVGEELKLNALRNSYTPGNFVALDADTTIAINGTDTTFEKGTQYGVIMQAQLDADKIPMKVWDPAADGGLGSSDGFDGWFNADNAKAELAAAVEELKALGVEVSAENPIQIDLPVWASNEGFANRANAYKQSLETVLGGAVKVNLPECVDAEAWYNAGYFTNLGEDANYDVYDVSGWSPDYGDPASYLDTFLPDYAGFMVKCIGIF